MEKVVVEVALTGTQDDFSTNARTDVLQKYSRFHGKPEFSVWCNAPDVKHIESFRDLVFQINPNHITCVYKKMFETSALCNLRIADGYTCTGKKRGGQRSQADYRNDTNVYLDYPGHFQEHVATVDKSNSCVYNTGIKTQSISKSALKMSDIHGWDICDNPHSTYNTGYQKPVKNEAQTSSKLKRHNGGYRSLSPFYKTFPATLRGARSSPNGNMCRSGSAGLNGRGPSSDLSTPSRDTDKLDSTATGSLSSAGCNGNGKTTVIKEEQRFRHFVNNSSYIDQYREEYTYQRLMESRDSLPKPKDDNICSCGISPCSGSLTQTKGIQRWYPNQCHLEQSKKSSTCEKGSYIIPAAPVPNRTPVLKPRPPSSLKQKRTGSYNWQVPKIDHKPKKSSSVGFHRNRIPRFDIFATSLTVNNYNPVTTPPSSAHKYGCQSPSSVFLGCDRASTCGQTGSKCSPVPMAVSSNQKLNQTLKGTQL